MYSDVSITGGKLQYTGMGQADINSNLTSIGNNPIKVRVYVSLASIQSSTGYGDANDPNIFYFQHWDGGNVGTVTKSEIEAAVNGVGYFEKTITQGSHFAGSLCFNLGSWMTSGIIEISKIEIFDV